MVVKIIPIRVIIAIHVITLKMMYRVALTMNLKSVEIATITISMTVSSVAITDSA